MSENKKFAQTISGLQHKNRTLEENLEITTKKFDSSIELKDTYENVVAAIMRPPSTIIDTLTFGKFRKVGAKENPVELMEFLETTGLRPKISNLGEDFRSMVEAMNDLKKTFENIKIVPNRLIDIGEYSF